MRWSITKCVIQKRLKHLFHSCWWLPFIVNDNRVFFDLIWLMSSQQAIKNPFSWQMPSHPQTNSVRHTHKLFLSFLWTHLTSTNTVVFNSDVLKQKQLETWTVIFSHRAFSFKKTRFYDQMTTVFAFSGVCLHMLYTPEAGEELKGCNSLQQ